MATQVAAFSHQAIKSAAANRICDFSLGLPGERVRVQVGKLKGNVLVWSASTEIPPTLAEQQAEIGQMLSAVGTVPFYAQILSDPRNLEILRKLPSFTGMKIPGLDDVERQIEDNQKLLAATPLPNPQLEELKEQLQMLDQQAQMSAQQNPAMAQQIVQQAQQQAAQLQQQIQAIPPLIPSIQPAQDASQDHLIRAAIALSEMKSARGKAAQNGSDEQKQGFLNLALNWQAHATIAQKMQPPPPVEMRASVTIDPTKLPPAAQAIAFERLGFQMPPVALQTQDQDHEITEETEGVNPETGVPTKRKVSVVGKPLS
jgi:FtsZ-binding cell division protein ZapB